MTSNTEGRLELSWYNKDKALIPKTTGRYGYAWVDPRDPRYCETHTLVMNEYVEGVQQPKQEGVVYGERADLEPTTDNLLILGESGDVLEALTRVPELATRYVGKVKCIYIDPPFNTGELFANYEDNLEHSVWLTMMRDRLLHMRRLLSSDGSIWVHLDDAEVHRMRALLDEVFGPGSFVAQLTWEKVAGRDNRTAVSTTCDTILLYAPAGKTAWRHVRNLIPRTAAQIAAAYENPDDDPRGIWTSGDFSAKAGPDRRAEQFWDLTLPSGRVVRPAPGNCWRFTEDRYEELLADDRLYFGEGGDNVPRVKRFLTEVQDGLVPKSHWPFAEVGTNDTAKKEISSLFPDGGVFSTPKPERLLERIIHIATNPGDVVMDVFAGSGTTAAVAHKMGRRWVTCELIEDTFNRFTRPRMEKAVKGDDSGGVTRTEVGTRIPLVDLPEEMDPETAWSIDRALDKASATMEARVDITKVLSRTVRKDAKSDAPALDDEERKALLRLFKKFSGSDEATMDLLPVLKKTLVDQLKTQKAPDVVNWRGGGGFQVAYLSPACFDYDPEFGIVTLTEAARNEEHLRASVAAHFGFRRTPDDRHFHGVRGSMRLYVTRTPITPDSVTTLAARLAEGESLTVASTVVVDGSAEALRAVAKGSRVIHIPSDLFPVLTKDKR